MNYLQMPAVVVVGCVIGYLLDRGVVKNMRSMLDGLVRRSAASEFFQRAFRTCIAMTIGGAALGHSWDNSKPLMEQVWSVAGTTGSMMGMLTLVVVTFALFATVLTATLGRRPTDPPVCLKCGYNLKGQIAEVRCPECGELYAGRE